MDSILTDTKQALGIEPEDSCFDKELIIHINSVIFSLLQLGVGPEEGYEISSSLNTWSELIGTRKDLAAIRTYVFLKVRLIFDPPQNSFLVASIERQCQEYEWRIEVQT